MMIYKHFKGGMYTIVTLALDSETEESVVVYQNLDNHKVWVRKKENFFAVLPDGKRRFELVEWK